MLARDNFISTLLLIWTTPTPSNEDSFNFFIDFCYQSSSSFSVLSSITINDFFLIPPKRSSTNCPPSYQSTRVTTIFFMLNHKPCPNHLTSIQILRLSHSYFTKILFHILACTLPLDESKHQTKNNSSHIYFSQPSNSYFYPTIQLPPKLII